MRYNWKKTIFSDGSTNFISNNNPEIGDTITISIRLQRNIKLKNIYLVIWPRGEVFYYLMKKFKSDDFFNWYSVDIKITHYKLNYRFYLIVNNKEYYYTPYGLFGSEPPDYFSFTLYANADYSLWSPEAIFYQIFPDRFYRKDNTELDDRELKVKFNNNEITIKRVLSNWDDPINKEPFKTKTMQYYGGNLSGIRDKIEYLKELGVTSLYLTPIFYARSNHRYDIEDYLKIDTLLGNENDLKELIEELHKNQMKIILDGVLNHTGIYHKWFDYGKEHNPAGAYASKDSIYKDFYYFSEHPDKYESWMDTKILPQLNLENKELWKDLFINKNSAIKKWLLPPYNIDGWRMDTASILGKFPLNQIDDEFNKSLHKAIKEENKDAFILGETFYDPKQLIDRDKYESVMNYRGFLSPIRKWLCGVTNFMSVPGGNNKHKVKFSVKKMAQQLLLTRAGIPFQNQIRMYNLLNSHDTERFITLLNKDMKKLKIAITILFTYIGIPAIYYGDEIGLEGEKDPDCRRPMIWEKSKQNLELFELYKKLIKLRKTYKSLVYGSIIELYANKNIYSYARFLSDEIIIVVCNGSKRENDLKIYLNKLGLNKGFFIGFYSGKKIEVINNSIFVYLFPFETEIFIYQKN